MSPPPSQPDAVIDVERALRETVELVLGVEALFHDLLNAIALNNAFNVRASRERQFYMRFDHACPICGLPRPSYQSSCDYCGLKEYPGPVADDLDGLTATRWQIRERLRHHGSWRAVVIFCNIIAGGAVGLKIADDRGYGCYEALVLMVGIIIVLQVLSVASEQAVRRETLKGDKVVLWLRRFGRERSSMIFAAQGLVEATRGVAVSVTVQDSSIRLWSELALTRLLGTGMGRPVVNAFTLLVVVGWMIVEIGLEESRRPLGYLLLAVIVSVIIAATIYSLSFISIHSDHPSGHAREVLEKATSSSYARLSIGERLWAALAGPLLRLFELAGWKEKTSLAGLIVLRCPPTHWQEVVGEGISQAFAVVFDATDTSPSLEWEIERAIEVVGRESIVVISPVGRHREPLGSRAAWEAVQAHGLKKIVRYCVSRPESIKGRWRHRVAFSRRLQRQLDRAIAASLRRRRELDKAGKTESM